MILKDEIDLKGREYEIHPSNVERDYVFGWILNGFFTVSDLKDQIFLKGGNALRKGYFDNTRYSKDLDFGLINDIDETHLLSEINKVCDYVGERAKIIFNKDETVIEEKFTASETPLPDLKVFEIKVYFQDFYGKKSTTTLKVGIDLTRFDKVLLPIQMVPLIHPYSDADDINCTIRCMKLEEIVATKLKCLLQRQHAPDMFDYAYAIKYMGGTLNTEEVVKTLVQKTIFGRNPHMLKKILINTSLAYFREYWNKSLICAKSIYFDVEEGISIFVQNIEKAFTLFPDNGYNDFAFFGPELRVPIMEAGRNQTLLEIVYKGEKRMVEPYSLKYLRRKDGLEREYFYVYKQSGGQSSPCVQSLVADNFQGITNTDIKFKPQFQIELCKSGELPENPYLFDPNRPQRPIRSFSNRSTSRSYGIKYSYKCSVCGKTFTRNSMTNSLNKHKNKNGYDCYGSYGIYQGAKH